MGNKVPNWECLLVHRKQGLFLSVYLADFRMAGKKPNMAPMWKKLSKKTLIWTKTTSFLDHVYLRCTQRECKLHEIGIE